MTKLYLLSGVHTQETLQDVCCTCVGLCCCQHQQTSSPLSSWSNVKRTLCVQLLSPTQVARCIVQGWPYTPDTLAICSWVAAEDGDAGALAVLTAPSRSAATSGAAAWPTSSNQNAFPAANHNRGGRGEHLTAACPWQHCVSACQAEHCGLWCKALVGLRVQKVFVWCSAICLLSVRVCVYMILLFVLQGHWP